MLRGNYEFEIVARDENGEILAKRCSLTIGSLEEDVGKIERFLLRKEATENLEVK